MRAALVSVAILAAGFLGLGLGYEAHSTGQQPNVGVDGAIVRLTKHFDACNGDATIEVFKHPGNDNFGWSEGCSK